MLITPQSGAHFRSACLPRLRAFIAKGGKAMLTDPGPIRFAAFAFAVALLGAPAMPSLAAAAGPDDRQIGAGDATSVESWLSAHLATDGIVDFDTRCRSKSADCHVLDARLLSKLLRGAATKQDIVISGAVIDGDLDLIRVTFDQALVFKHDIFHGTIKMSSSEFKEDVLFASDAIDSGLIASNSQFDGRLVFSEKTTIARTLDMHETSIKRGLSLIDSHVAAQVDFDNASVSYEFNINNSNFAGLFHAYNVVIDGVLTINGGSRFEATVTLQAADVTRVAHISNASFVGGLNAKWAHFKKSLLIDDGTTFDAMLELDGAHVDDDIILERAEFRKSKTTDKSSQYSVDWERIDVQGSVLIKNGARFQSAFDMIEAKIGGNVEIGSSDEDCPVAFEQKFNLSLSQINNSIYIHDASFAAGASIASAQIARHLDVAGSQFSSLNLSRSTIGGDFRMWPQPSQNYRSPLAWNGSAPTLNLRYAHIDVIQDEIALGTAEPARWPAKIDVEGLTFDHFGTQRNADWAQDWLERWRHGSDVPSRFNPQPFEEMANYFKRVGAQDDADQIRTRARDLELYAYRRQCGELDADACWHFLRVGFLKIFVGYGIGYGLFWVLLPTILFVLIGWLVLQTCQAAKKKGALWCGLASLNKLIPGINFNKEFSDAFDNPDILKLSSGQACYFFIHTIVGVVLASAIFAAIAGLTQAR